MKIGEQIVIDCESLQSLEALTADNWHDMAEADAKLVARRLVSDRWITDAQRVELAAAAQRLLIYSRWCRSYTLAVMTLAKRP